MDVDRFQLFEIIDADVEHVPLGLTNAGIGNRLIDPAKFGQDVGHAFLDGGFISNIDNGRAHRAYGSNGSHAQGQAGQKHPKAAHRQS